MAKANKVQKAVELVEELQAAQPVTSPIEETGDSAEVAKMHELIMQQGTMIGELQKENKSLKEENALLIESLGALNASVPAKKQEPVSLAKPTVEVNGELYKFRVPRFHFAGKNYTAEEAAQDTALIGSILEIATQGILAPVAK